MNYSEMLAKSSFATAHESIKSAYVRGLRSGHGIACHNVPELGAKLNTDSLGRVTVDADNIREVHESLCFEAESSSRDFSPFEFTAHEFNSAGDGGWKLTDTGSDTPLDTVYESKEDAEAASPSIAQAIATEEKCDLADVVLTVSEVPSSDELWEAYDAGIADAIHADLSTYSNEDYGIPLIVYGQRLVSAAHSHGLAIPTYDDGTGSLWIHRNSMGISGIVRADTWETAYGICEDEFFPAGDTDANEESARIAAMTEGKAARDHERACWEEAYGYRNSGARRMPDGSRSYIYAKDLSGDSLDPLTPELVKALEITLCIENE